MVFLFRVHRHKTRRSHFDLRIAQADRLRSWSMLRQPPVKKGERRLAIERETFASGDIDRRRFSEDAFGEGDVYTWDEGGVVVSALAPDKLLLEFRGTRLNGKYEIKRMRWYPGNHWILSKI